MNDNSGTAKLPVVASTDVYGLGDRPSIATLTHRQLRRDHSGRTFPPTLKSTNRPSSTTSGRPSTITNPDKLLAAVQSLVSPGFTKTSPPASASADEHSYPRTC